MRAKDENRGAARVNAGATPPQDLVSTGSSSPPGPLAEQIENAFSKIKVGRAHYYIMAMMLLGVFFDSFEPGSTEGVI